MAASLHNIFIFVTDMARASSFYAGQLGLPIAGENEMMIEFFPGASPTLTLSLAFQEETRALVGGHTGITLKIDDIDAVCQALAASGVTFVMPYEATPWGKMAVVQDPDGNQIRLWNT